MFRPNSIKQRLRALEKGLTEIEMVTSEFILRAGNRCQALEDRLDKLEKDRATNRYPKEERSQPETVEERQTT